MKKTVGALFILLNVVPGTWTGQALAAPDAAAGQAKAAVCGACHGPDGNSLAPEWPKLAGQAPEYLAKQLHDFKAGRRSDQTMGPMAQPLTEQDIADLAAYFSAQKVQPGQGKAEAVVRGREIYEKGTHRPKVVACVGCHGPSGAGSADWKKLMATQPAMLAPALAGQQTAYVVKQLKAYKDGSRGNDVGHVMRGIVSHLSEADMAAVAEYITALKR